VSDELLSAARAAQARAYCPYSGFAVGAALEVEDGRVFSGCNVENASYGLTLCAERAAVMAAVAGGARRFRRLVVATSVDPPPAPCGACRQVLLEFGPDLAIESAGLSERRSWTLAALLPAGFGSDSLDRVDHSKEKP
jgi:cytidine deaminase